MCLSIRGYNQIEQDELSMFECVCEPKEGGRATGCDPQPHIISTPQPHNISTPQPHSIAHYSCCSSSIGGFVLFCFALKGFLLLFACMYMFVRPSQLNLTR